MGPEARTIGLEGRAVGPRGEEITHGGLFPVLVS